MLPDPNKVAVVLRWLMPEGLDDAIFAQAPDLRLRELTSDDTETRLVSIRNFSHHSAQKGSGRDALWSPSMGRSASACKAFAYSLTREAFAMNGAATSTHGSAKMTPRWAQ